MSKYYKIVTLGCKVNSYESEAMAQQLEHLGYQELVDDNIPELIIINTCSVTSTSDAKSRQMIHREHQKNPAALLIVAGCYSQIASETVAKIPGVCIVIGTEHRNEIADLIAEYNKTHMVVVRVNNSRQIKNFEALAVTSYNDNTRAFLKIQDGCNNFCSYCIIPYARGPMRSRAASDVIEEAQKLVDTGFKEIVLTGIHTAGYGLDMQNYSFCQLLKDLLRQVPRLKRIRISSIEESEISADLIDLLQTEPRIVPHLHIPLQSGCDSVLKRMNRKYLTADFYKTITKIREKLPDIAITTDVIVGFPQETEEEFNQTVAFINKVNFSALHVFPYSRRSGTVADKMSGQIEGPVKKQRVHTLIDLSNDLACKYAKRFEGKALAVLFETYDEKTEMITGHAPNYLKVACPGTKDYLNKIENVIITNSGYPQNFGKLEEK